MKRLTISALAFFMLAIAGSCISLNAALDTKIRKENKTDKTERELDKLVIEGPDNAVKYIDRFKAIAVAEMKRTGVPASIKLAQGILESGYGSSELAKKANNHFGMKCGSQWNGKSYKHQGSCYRAYPSAEICYKEHSEFLKRKHYEGLFKLKKTDYKGWAKGLQKAGYATDKNYPSKLIELIERFKLYKFDQLG
jgi:flagellum-specific peptidoglycan hydrolase FlgJ